jgi:copper chaperone CopZ
MKIRFFSILFFEFLFNLVSAQFIKAELRADGLTCSLCIKATERQLQTLYFIDSIGINYDQTTFLLYFKKGSDVDFQQIRKMVENAGFTVGILKVTYNFKDFRIDSIHSFNLQNNILYFVNVNPQIANGENQIQLIDDGFISKKEYRKYAHYLTTHKDSTDKHSFHSIYKPG